MLTDNEPLVIEQRHRDAARDVIGQSAWDDIQQNKDNLTLVQAFARFGATDAARIAELEAALESIAFNPTHMASAVELQEFARKALEKIRD